MDSKVFWGFVGVVLTTLFLPVWNADPEFRPALLSLVVLMLFGALVDYGRSSRREQRAELRHEKEERAERAGETRMRIAKGEDYAPPLQRP